MALDRKIWPGAFGVVLLPLIGGVAALLLMLGTWQQDVTVVGQGIIICGITWVVVWLYQRHVTSRRRGLSGTADALANFIDVFHPEQARSQRALRELHSRTVAPAPDDEDDPVQLLTDRDGTPRAARIRRRDI